MLTTRSFNGLTLTCLDSRWKHDSTTSCWEELLQEASD